MLIKRVCTSLTLVGLLSGAALLNGCATEEIKKTYDGMVSGKDDSNSRPVVITSVSKEASTVVDLHCPRMVKPYKLSDNLMSIGALSLQLGFENGVGALTMAAGLPGTPKTNIPATARLAAKQFNWMPMPAERMYGDMRHKDKELEILPRTAKTEKDYLYADKILADVKDSIGEPHDYDLKIFILKEPGTHAMSFAGGYLYIERGLVNPKARSKAYFAVAHEVAHIMQRHETKELESTVIDSIGMASDLMKLLSSAGSNPGAILTFVSGSKNLFSKHFIDQELQADACATKMMVKMFPKKEQVRQALQDFQNSLDKPEPEEVAKTPANDLEKYALSLHTLVNSPYRRHPNTLVRRKNIDQMYAQITIQIDVVPGAPASNLAPPASAVRKSK